MPKRVRGGVRWIPTPTDAVFMGARGKYGFLHNPFVLGKTQIRLSLEREGDWKHEGRLHKTSGEKNFFCTGVDDRGMPTGVWHQIENASLEQCQILYRELITGRGSHLGWNTSPRLTDEVIAELKGKDLACTCPKYSPSCHVDILLELINS